MILLIILTVVMIIGAICQQNVAAIGYVGILIMTFLMMRYPFKQIKKSRRGYMGSYIRPLLFGWQHFILYEKHCFCIPELRWWESRLFFEQSADI